jgi:hypothetical protein
MVPGHCGHGRVALRIDRDPLGNGSNSAAPKIATITATRTRLATVTSKIDQCTKVAGEFTLTARSGTADGQILTWGTSAVYAHDAAEVRSSRIRNLVAVTALATVQAERYARQVPGARAPARSLARIAKAF